MPLFFDVLSKKPVPLASVKKLLGKAKKKELTLEQKMVVENVNEFAKLTEKQAGGIIKGLEELNIRKLKPEMMVKIVDVMPQDIEELRLILSDSPIAFKKQELESILSIVKENAK